MSKTKNIKTKKVEKVEKIEELEELEELEEHFVVENEDTIEDGSKSKKSNSDIGELDLSEVDTEFTLLCESLLEKITKNYKEQKDDIKKLLKMHRNELRNAKKTTKKRKNNIKTGFTKPEKVPDKLAKFLGLNLGTVLPRTNITKKVYDEIKNRGLLYEKDKRVIRADKELLKLFDLTENVNKSVDPYDKNGINFFNLQRYIAKVYSDDETNNSTKNTV